MPKSPQTRRTAQRPLRPTAADLARIKPIPEVLRPGLDVLFVGINPGVVSGTKQLHFGNPQNFFWRGLFQSGLIPEEIPPEQGHRLWDEWNMSITNLVQRTTPSTTDLTRQEMRAAVPQLCRKISANSPRVVCFVGIGAYQAFVGRPGCTLGLQDVVYDASIPPGDQIPPAPLRGLDAEPDPPSTGVTRIFVMPSTSGRTAAYQNPQKLQYLRQLKYVRDCLVQAQPIDDELLARIGPRTESRYFQNKRGNSDRVH
ncbi:uracil DNA N-glycosylase Thp1 [Coemansia sp. RSA 552]|nr:uracil DNA N-glycosylase Thp1 [Coemansia sp. RSA 552]